MEESFTLYEMINVHLNGQVVSLPIMLQCVWFNQVRLYEKHPGESYSPLPASAVPSWRHLARYQRPPPRSSHRPTPRRTSITAGFSEQRARGSHWLRRATIDFVHYVVRMFPSCADQAALLLWVEIRGRCIVAA